MKSSMFEYGYSFRMSRSVTPEGSTRNDAAVVNFCYPWISIIEPITLNAHINRDQLDFFGSNNDLFALHRVEFRNAT